MPTQRDGERGFAMVALLIGMAIAAIWMTAALKYWPQQVQREREDDLIFRGEQYARAIVYYQLKNRGLPPPDVDTLVSQHFLRKKWKDPVTNKDFDMVGPGIISQGQTGVTQPGQSGSQQMGSGQINTGGNQQPGVTGVRSKSTATSIKVYNNQQQYNLWQFDAALYRQNHGLPSFAQQQQQQNGRQGGAPGDRTGRDSGPGGATGGRQGVAPGRGGEQGARPAPPAVPIGGRGRGGF